MQQRKSQRFDLRLPFEIVSGGTKSAAKAKARTKVKGQTRNVSSSGVLFMSKAPVEVGAPIEFLITLPKTPGTRADVRLHCIGTVVRRDNRSRIAATLERYEFVRPRRKTSRPARLKRPAAGR